MFDCDNLKSVNDRFGHDKGDEYLKAGCKLICQVFEHSPVFRIGGDEFAVLLRGEDYGNREDLARLFEERGAEICEAAENEWEKPHVALGIATYDPEIDGTVDDVTRRADRLMYDYKRKRKEARSQEAASA